jgi:hypothetical protein
MGDKKTDVDVDVDVVSEVVSSLEIQRSKYEVGTEIRHAYNEALDRLRVLASKLEHTSPLEPQNIMPGKWQDHDPCNIPHEVVEHRQKWEYNYQWVGAEEEPQQVMHHLDAWGKTGWEAYAAIVLPDGSVMNLMKRLV